MKLACQLTNGDNYFAVATIDLTPGYVEWLLRMIDEAARVASINDSFYALELWDARASFGSDLGPLSQVVIHLIALNEWAEVPDHQWAEGRQQNTEMGTVVVAPGWVHWRAAPIDGNMYYDTVPLRASSLRAIAESA